MTAYTFLLVFVAGASLGVGWALMRIRRQGRVRVEAARAEAKLAIRGAQGQARALVKAAETRGRERALEVRERMERDAARRLDELAAREQRLTAREHRLKGIEEHLRRESEALDVRYREMRQRQTQSRQQKQAAAEARKTARVALEARAGESSDEIMKQLERSWVAEAEGEALHRLRAVNQSAGDPDWLRRAERVMEIAVARYRNHFLTERPMSNIALNGVTARLLTADGDEFLHALEVVANIQLTMAESGDSVRLEGLDGVGREIARRALNRLNRKPELHGEAVRDPAAWVRKIRGQLEQEIQGLGKKAFAALKLSRAHPEIVSLVGRLNYRTSFTQNQWLHAVEASFLAGMIAAELNLDVILARRATLLHDIGKALTHELDGSHAVIGADIARRLGENEVVANAIGAHHADEQPASAYAYIVAGADAMSGARPGARREQTDGYSTRLQDLERIGQSYAGVERCYAVHGGRELRVYVHEAEVSDLRALELTREIAEQVSGELTFPGQIKITVIRATEAVAIAS